jgi:hypothetical protein
MVYLLASSVARAIRIRFVWQEKNTPIPDLIQSEHQVVENRVETQN